MKDYKDIIDHPHYEPKNHPRMSMLNRAAQFSPFAALTGYGDAVNETAKMVEERVLSEGRAADGDEDYPYDDFYPELP